MELTTFGKVEEHINAFEQKQADTTNSNTQQTDTGTQNAADATNGQAASTDATDTTQQSVASGSEEIKDSTDFNISLGEGNVDTGQTTNQTTQVQQPVFNLKEELKKADHSEVLKELGIGEFAIELNNHIKAGGDPIDYLNARAIDYNKVTDEALLKDSIKREYPNLSPSQVDLMFNKKYGVPEDASDEDKEFFTTQLQADAYKVRQSKISEQQKFKVPEGVIPTKDEAYEQWKQYRDSQPVVEKQINDYFENHQATKALNESKKVTISLGDGVKPFNFNVDKPELLTKAFIDGGETWRKLTSTATGEPDVPKQQLIALFSHDPQKFIQEIFNYGQQTGVRKKLVDEGQNAQRPTAKIVSVDTNANPTYGTGKYGDKQRQ